MDNLDIHKAENSIRTYLKVINKLPERNRKLILDFKRECEKQGLSNNRILFYLTKLSRLARKIQKNLDDLSKKDIEDVIIQVEKNENYGEWSKAGYKITIKKFYQWLDGYDWNSKEYPEKVKWLRTGARKSKLDDPIILTKEEVIKLFNVAKGVKEKALVSFMYESGCRVPDELLHMKVGDIAFDDYGARVKLQSGKVGSRIIRVVSCVPHLKNWIENGHKNPKYDNYLWVGKGSSIVMSYSCLRKLISKWKGMAGIQKKITPYTLRRTRYTHLANKIPTPALYKYMGQVQGSKVIERYVNLSEEATDEAILNFYGITNPENSDIKPLFCSRCRKQNPPESEYCSICNGPLTEKAMLEVEEKKKVDMKDFVEILIQKRMEELRKELSPK
jgi:integrase